MTIDQDEIKNYLAVSELTDGLTNEHFSGRDKIG